MNDIAEDINNFEIAIVVPKQREELPDPTRLDYVEFLVVQLDSTGFIVERVVGISDMFIKLAVPIRVMGRAAAAAELGVKKLTYIGMDLPFEWEQVSAFVRQTDGLLFS